MSSKFHRILSACIAFILLVVFSASFHALQASTTLQPEAIFWPLPATSSQHYWWYYSWTRGSKSPCPLDQTPRPVAIAASSLSDGAFGDNNLLSFSFFKTDKCTYWSPSTTTDLILRWYSKRFVTSNTYIYDQADPNNYADKFLSFRGASLWYPLRTSQTNFLYNNQLKRYVNGRYAYDYELGKYPYYDGQKYTYNVGDNAQLPLYPILPNRFIDADIVLSSNPAIGLINGTFGATNVPRYCSYIGAAPNAQTAWWNQRYSPNTCSFDPGHVRWAMYIRRTTYTWQGKPVLYIGYSETAEDNNGNPTEPGACEDWWFAQDIGPIYIANYGTLSYADCKNTLGMFTGSALTNPPVYLMFALPKMVDLLSLYDRCIGTGCSVQYIP